MKGLRPAVSPKTSYRLYSLPRPGGEASDIRQTDVTEYLADSSGSLQFDPRKLDWVIVRPVILTDGPKTNAYRALADARDWTCGFVSRADVADFLVKQIDDDAFLYKTPVLTS